MSDDSSTGYEGTSLADPTGDGKHWQVTVPSYTGGSGGKHVYLRLGAAHPSAGNAGSVDLGEDLAVGVPASLPSFYTTGGVRDHTDANRVVTTRGALVDVIGGPYRRVLAATPSSADPPDYVPVDSSTDITLAAKFYELTGAADYKAATVCDPPGASSALADHDIFEYTYGEHVTDLIAGATQLTELSYGGKVLEVSSTVHASHKDWEATTDGGPGGGKSVTGTFDFADLLLGKSVLEVARGETYLEERLICDNGDFLLALGAPNGTFIEELWGKNLVEHTRADLDITAKVHAGGGIDEVTTAAGGINAFESAGGAIMDTVLAGGAVVELTAATLNYTDITAAVASMLEVAVAAFKLEIAAAFQTYEIALGATFEFELAHTRFALVESSLVELHTEVTGVAARVRNLTTTVGNVNTRVGAVETTVADEATHVGTLHTSVLELYDSVAELYTFV